jgi:DNA topoisomerase-2
MQEISIKDLLNGQLVNYASYDNIRKIGSAIDGLKNAARKVIFTVHEKKIKDKTKVLQLSNKCAEYADYLHGSLDGVVVTLGQDFAGTNNIPLIQKFGNFGTRCIQEASAPRYIFARGSDALFELFKYEDDEILDQQFFEGSRIEPKFYVPTLPMLLVNGSEGVSSGFAQKILPRNPEKLKQYILEKLSGKEPSTELLNPWIKNFNGSFEQGEEPNKWIVKGKIEHVKGNEYLISEIPFTYDLKSYVKVLDDLSDKKNIIRYSNESDGENTLKFRVTLPRGIDTSEDALLERLKLLKPISENYTSIDDNLKVREFKNSKEIIDFYIDIKLKYLNKRKIFLIEKINTELSILKMKSKFLNEYISGSIKIQNVSKSEIEKQLVDYLKVDGSYNYLIGMPIYSLTSEKLEELEKTIAQTEKTLSKTQKTSIEKMWSSEL